MSDKFSDYPQYDNDTTTDCEDCEARIRAEVIEELKPFVHFNYKGKKFLFVCAEDFNNLSFAEQLKENKND